MSCCPSTPRFQARAWPGHCEQRAAHGLQQDEAQARVAGPSVGPSQRNGCFWVIRKPQVRQHSRWPLHVIPSWDRVPHSRGTEEDPVGRQNHPDKVGVGHGTLSRDGAGTWGQTGGERERARASKGHKDTGAHGTTRSLCLPSPAQRRDWSPHTTSTRPSTRDLRR